MIKQLKLQKAVIVLLLGVIALVVYKVMSIREMETSIYALEVAGIFFILGALMFLYPIVSARKDKGGKVQLDPEKPVADDIEHETP